MTDATELHKVDITRRLKAPPERVFDAWLDPAMLARFMTPGPDVTVPKAENDPREGGRFLVVMRSGERDLPHAGTYRRIDRPRRLVFTWESPMIEGEDSEVTLDFTPEGDGTKLRLVHTRLPGAESRDNHDAGWARILDTLDAAL